MLADEGIQQLWRDVILSTQMNDLYGMMWLWWLLKQIPHKQMYCASQSKIRCTISAVGHIAIQANIHCVPQVTMKIHCFTKQRDVNRTFLIFYVGFSQFSEFYKSPCNQAWEILQICRHPLSSNNVHNVFESGIQLNSTIINSTWLVIKLYIEGDINLLTSAKHQINRVDKTCSKMQHCAQLSAIFILCLIRYDSEFLLVDRSDISSNKIRRK